MIKGNYYDYESSQTLKMILSVFLTVNYICNCVGGRLQPEKTQKKLKGSPQDHQTGFGFFSSCTPLTISAQSTLSPDNYSVIDNYSGIDNYSIIDNYSVFDRIFPTRGRNVQPV